MSKEKVVNYTPEQTAMLKAEYLANPDKKHMEAIAASIGKTYRSVVAKLTREGVYKKAEYVTKNGAKPVFKDATANEIGEMLGLSDAETDSIAKANKSALMKVLTHLKVAKAQFEAFQKAETENAETEDTPSE